MKWFKHDTNAATDAKLRKLIIKHGATGYAVYFYCLELIASEICESNITFELEHDSEIISDSLRITGTSTKSGADVVEGIMRYMVDIGLFENNDGRITCYKLMKRLDSSMTSNSRLRTLIVKAKDNHDKVMIQSCKTRLDKTILDYIPSEKTPDGAPTSVDGEAESTEVAVATPSPPSLSAMKDDLANAYQDAFTSVTPAQAWKSIPQERKHLSDLAKRTRSLADVTGNEEQELAERVLYCFSELRRTGRADYWRNAPFVPSALTSRWDAVIEQLRKEAEAPEVVF